MLKCPNCGQETARTTDWACQWCGYPLISKSYKRIQQTFKQVKEERLQQREPKPAAMIGHDEKARQGDMVRHDAERLSGEQTGLEAREIRETAKRERKAKQQAERLIREKVRQEAIARKEINKKAQEATRKQAREDIKHTRLEEEAWKEAMHLSHMQAEKKAEEAKERVMRQAKALKAAEAQKEAEKKIQLEEEAWKEAMRLSQVQANKEAEEARERAKWQAEIEPEPAVDVLELSIDEFSSAFSEDSAAAHEKFANAIIRLTGKVGKVVTNEINNNYFVNITVDKKDMILRDVRCKFDKQHATELKELIKGEIARVQGEYNGYVIDISMKNCILVR
jgi:hypothetical protein